MQHNECLLIKEQQRAFLKRSPIRLIDVEERKIIHTTQQEQEYLALSYVWGETTEGSLTSATVEEFSSSQGLPDDPDVIPRTILDAIRLTRDIGFRYLWVDSLCILQDNDRDKLHHLPHMDSIYSCANLVIIAAAGDNAHEGLPGVVRSRDAWHHSENVDGVPLITCRPLLREVLEQTEWNRRGWTFQEAILARRTLVFTKHQAYWNCRVDCWREDMTCTMAMVPTAMNDRNSLWAKTYFQGSCPTRIYCDHVERFSSREFKESRDALWAFAGVLRLMASHFPRGFIWGLPHSIHGMGGELYRLRFPSWSWLSLSAGVDFLHSCEGYVVSKVSWHEPLYIGKDTTLPTYLESIQADCDNLYKGYLSQQDGILSSNHTQNSGIMHYGFLRFTAQTAQLDIKRHISDNQWGRDSAELNG
ncbi:hypothetical protein Hte_012146 [Hypoxylon texense]